MPYINETNEYLKLNFPDVPLEPPLFYNAPIGIRFELGVAYKGIKDEKYLRNACLRATLTKSSQPSNQL